MPIIIREMTRQDWPLVAEIYGQGINTRDATFERDVPTWEVWDASRLKTCRLVAEVDYEVSGFACVSPTSTREVYAGVCEVMIYVADGSRGHGLGGRLMRALVEATEAEGIWTLQASMFRENVASIQLHERVGFRVVWIRERIGRFWDGQWRDTVFMERRSLEVGVE